MGSLSLFFVLFLCIFGSFGTIFVNGNEGFLYVDGNVSIGQIDVDFICATMDWWPPDRCDYGICKWDRASLLTLDLNNIFLLNAIRALSPLKIRLGGTLQDKVIYQTEENQVPCNPFTPNPSELFGYTEGCFPLSRWDQLNDFFQKAGAPVIFGLNALFGRSISGSLAVQPWDPANAESFIRYTARRGYNVVGWELGNELCGIGVGVRVEANQYASDIIVLRRVVDGIYQNSPNKPIVIAPGGFFDADWFTTFMRNSNNSVGAVTHHIYNLGAGIDENITMRILDPEVLDDAVGIYSQLQSIIASSGSPTYAWVGEAGGAYNGGRDGVSNAFVYSFWYLDQLGMSATYGTKTYCRQALVGGNYGLLNTDNFAPHPDYYSALLWHQVMGRNVLSARFTGPRTLRAYAHCAKQSQGITLLLINLDGMAPVQVNVAHIQARRTAGHHHHHHHHRLKVKSNVVPRQKAPVVREEYHLTAKDGDLHSQIMLLNGVELGVDPFGNIPRLIPQPANPADPITVAPFSIVFAHMPYILLPACA